MDIFEAFYGKYNRINRACANSVYQASPWGGGGEDWEQGYARSSQFL